VGCLWKVLGAWGSETAELRAEGRFRFQRLWFLLDWKVRRAARGSSLKQGLAHRP